MNALQFFSPSKATTKKYTRVGQKYFREQKYTKYNKITIQKTLG